MPKIMPSLVFLFYCVLFTEIADTMRKFVDILEQSLSQTRLCAIFKFIDWFTINKILRLTSNKYGLPEKSFSLAH